MHRSRRTHVSRTHAHPSRRAHPKAGATQDRRTLGNDPNGAAIGAWINWMKAKELSPKTRRVYIGRVRSLAAFLDREFGVTLLEANRAHLRAWRATLDGRPPRTVLAYIAHIRSFYRWADLEERRAGDPTLGLPVPRTPRGIPRPIAEDAGEYAIDTAPERVRPWLVLAGYAGLRACEIATLDRSLVFEQLDDPYMIVTGKYGKQRAVPLSPYVLAVLVPLLPARGYVFLRRDDKPGHVPESQVTKLSNQHLKDCGLTDTLHKFRHRFGTQAQRNGKNLRVTQELLGHADPKITAGYTDVSDPEKIAVVNSVQPNGRRLRAARRRPPNGRASSAR